MTTFIQGKTPILCMLIFLLPVPFSLIESTGLRAEERDRFSATVSYIIDGDSLMVKKDQQELEIRLWGIDAPEYDQAGAEVARRALSSLVSDGLIELEIVDIDRFGRLVAIASIGSLNVNEHLVRSGYAWVHVYYCKAPPCKKWYVFERRAREKKRGIWFYDDQVAPWEWKAVKKR